MRNKPAILLGFVVLGSIACGELTPTSIDDGLIPDDPITVEVRIPWDDFASNLRTVGGYGTPLELGGAVVAHNYADTLEARALARFALGFPLSVTLQDTMGTTVIDTATTVIGGRVVIVVDTLDAKSVTPRRLGIYSIHQEWHPRSVTWTHARDTVDDRVQWEEVGADPATFVNAAFWEPNLGDTAIIPLDSAQAIQWVDPSVENNVGMRIDVMSDTSRLHVVDVQLELDVRSTMNPDTTVTVSASRQSLTFIYSPSPDPAPGTINVGSVPALRSFLDIDVPKTLEIEELCPILGCPVTLTPDQINFASIVLRSRQGEAAFQPRDTVRLDVRPVLYPEALPKSPLGSSLLGVGVSRRIEPEIFGERLGDEVEIPITDFVRVQIDPDADLPFGMLRTIAIISALEPSSLAYASFWGPGTEYEPILRLVITAGRTLELP